MRPLVPSSSTALLLAALTALLGLVTGQEEATRTEAEVRRRRRMMMMMIMMMMMMMMMMQVIVTGSGPIRGRVVTRPDSEVTRHEWLGIPYARPPVGELRFQPPLPVEPWTEVLEADR